MITGFGILAAGLAGCSISQTEEPPLQGPSELALAFTLQAIPDILTQDGASQSQIVVQARNAEGQPAPSVTFRADISVAGVLTDFGLLSARTLATGSDGRATLMYTAPAAPVSVSTPQQVAIQIRPLGTDFANSLPRAVSILLMPPGVIFPGGPTPVFTINGRTNPANLTPYVDVLFDASGSIAAPGTAIVSYAWDFGDGSTALGVNAVHQFGPGTYTVKLTVTDTNNVAISRQQRILVVPTGVGPIAEFVFFPTAPRVFEDISFDASPSKAETGRTLVTFEWDFGDGVNKTGKARVKSYDFAGTFLVTLTVTDDIGRKATKSQTLTVVP